MENADSQPRAVSNKPLDFFRGFLKDPKQVGSVIPSSRFMERRIIDYARLQRCRSVVELGPGTGGTTRALLEAMRPDARLLAIDLNPLFTEAVASISDPRLISQTGSAADLGEFLGRHELGQADVVISGIPFSTMPAKIGSAIIRAIADHLSEDGAFVAYQFRSEVARLAWPVFGDPRKTEMVTLNIPPMRIWRWEKTT
ncbi:MAG: methyltransferase domain-containing protein [Wenzhouxiangellaceae bacterium]|nr:methyltransferase domain-containing protein [Wenzhouxiangellaceae bacterium]